MKNIILNFNDPNSLNSTFSGVKGANLSRLYQQHLNVPLGIIVSSKAYQLFIEQATWLDNHISKLYIENIKALSEQSLFIQNKLREIRIPEIIEKEIINSSIILSNKVAVRSSVTLEDNIDTNFSEPYDTFLNIKTNNILHYIKECWISLWSVSAILHRYEMGIHLIKNVKMAVVIQNMIQAEKSGKVSTINPVEGNFNQFLITTHYGLGEHSFESKIIPDQYIIDRTSSHIIDKSLSEKKLKLASLFEGVNYVEVSLKEKETEILSEKEIKKLFKLCEKIEKLYIVPQNIQWVYFATDFYLLNIKPITTIKEKWTRTESIKSFPNPVSPLAWELIEEGLHKSINFSLKIMGQPTFSGKWFKQINSYVYSNQNIIDLYNQHELLNVENILDLKNKLPALIEQSKWINDLPSKWFANLDNYLLKLGLLSGIDISNKTIPQLWEHILEINNVGTSYFLPNFVIFNTQKFLYHTLHKVLSLLVSESEVQYIFNDLVGFVETKAGLINYKMYLMAVYMQKNKAFFDQFNNGLKFLNFNPVSNEDSIIYNNFMQQFNNLITHHGHQTVDFDPYIPTWSETPDIVYDMLYKLFNSNLSDPKLEIERIRRNSAISLFKIQCAIPEPYLPLFSELVRLTQLYTLLEDIKKYETTRLITPLRSAMRAIGIQLMAYNIIQEPLDIFFANKKELEDCIYNGNDEKWKILKEKIITNKLQYLKSKENEPMFNIFV